MRLALLILASLAAGTSFAEDSPAVVLRKGVVQEEVDRDLNAAIQTYQKVAARAKEDRQAAATAFFRMAECYRTLGKSTEAATAYSRVARDFADQEQLAEESRRLIELLPKSAEQASPPTVRSQKLTDLDIRISKQQVALSLLKDKFQGDSPRVKEAEAQLKVLAYERAKEEAAESRRQLAAVGQLSAAGAPPNRADALKQFRALLERQISTAQAYSDYEKQQVSLGAKSVMDTFDTQTAVSRLQAQLAAFDAGLFPKQPSSPRTPQAQKAREDYRKSLVKAVEFAQLHYQAALAHYRLGVNQQTDVLKASFKLSDVQAQLTAFDAGLSYTPVAGALAP